MNLLKTNFHFKKHSVFLFCFLHVIEISLKNKKRNPGMQEVYKKTSD
jgi:hypothetical protein